MQRSQRLLWAVEVWGGVLTDEPWTEPGRANRMGEGEQGRLAKGGEPGDHPGEGEGYIREWTKPGGLEWVNQVPRCVGQ